MILLSVIIPLYNTAEYIEQCIRSIEECPADPSFFEVIVVDDGSTDVSYNVVEGLCAIFDNIILIHQENLGVSVARMKGVSLAKGDYIWFVDSDDYVVQGAVKEVLTLIQTFNGIDVFVLPMLLKTDSGDDSFYSHVLKEQVVVSGKELLKDKECRIVGPPQFVIKRCHFQNKWLFFPEGIRYEDEYFSRVLKYADGSFLLTPKCMYVYRQWRGSHMNSLKISDTQDIVAVYRYLDRYADEVVKEQDIPWFKNNIVSFLLESYTRNSKAFGTTEFKAFRNKYGRFIRTEWNKYKQYFSVKDKILGGVLLSCPPLYRRLIRVNGLLRGKLHNL